MTLPKDYQVHMLRIWNNSSDNKQNPSALRVTLEDTKTAVRVNFCDFDSLLDYLKTQTEAAEAT